MNVLVTGAAGFIGSNFVHYCLRNRPLWRIVALDLLTYAGNLANLKSAETNSAFSFVKGDINDRDCLEDIFSKQKFDMVFHLAAESHVDRSIESAREFVETNVLGTEALLSMARSHGVKRFIHISTDEVYGTLGAEGYFEETTPLDPTSPYAASKAASDLFVLAYGKTYDMDVCVTRCTNNYGPFQFPEKFIPLFITNAMTDHPLPLYGDGKNIRSWLYVDDHCDALVAVGERGRSGEVYNIGSEEEGELHNIDVAKDILKRMGKPESLIHYVKDRPAHDRRYAVTIAKIERELGWRPKVLFDEGIGKTIAWYQENRGWWESIKRGEYQSFYEQQYGKRLAPTGVRSVASA